MSTPASHPADHAPADGAAPSTMAFRIGALDCVALSDGYFMAPVKVSNPEVPPEELRVFLDAHGETGEFRRLQISCLTLRLPGTGERVLVDAGMGRALGPTGQPLATAGHALEALRAARIEPEDVDVVLVSHIHPDHVGGLFDDEDRAVFPNATYHVGEAEAAFWGGARPDLTGALLPPPMKANIVEAARRFLKLAGGKLRVFAAGGEVVAGVRSVPLPGHTPGQVGFLFESGGEVLLYTADAVAHPAVSLLRPDWRSAFDTNPAIAIGTRKDLVPRVAANRWTIFATHFPWPSVGRIAGQDGRFAWQPMS